MTDDDDTAPDGGRIHEFAVWNDFQAKDLNVDIGNVTVTEASTDDDRAAVLFEIDGVNVESK